MFCPNYSKWNIRGNHHQAIRGSLLGGKKRPRSDTWRTVSLTFQDESQQVVSIQLWHVLNFSHTSYFSSILECPTCFQSPMTTGLQYLSHPLRHWRYIRNALHILGIIKGGLLDNKIAASHVMNLLSKRFLTKRELSSKASKAIFLIQIFC